MECLPSLARMSGLRLEKNVIEVGLDVHREDHPACTNALQARISIRPVEQAIQLRNWTSKSIWVPQHQ
jgi:hypothetical protein